LNPLTRMLFILALAIGLFYAPGWLSAPFKWFEVFFHEFSHGLMAIVTGGSIERIDLQFVGSGTCHYRGGWRMPVAFAGYAGASLWGWAIYSSATASSKQTSRLLIGTLLVVMVMVALLWVRDWQSWVVLSVMAALLLLMLKYGEQSLLKFFVQFIGMFVLLASIQSPLFLLDGQARGDGATLQSITLIPEVVWIGLWVLIGLGVLLMIVRDRLRARV
jgi:hypothetical protein